MKKKNIYQPFLAAFLVIGITIGLSYSSVILWTGKTKEHIEVPTKFQFKAGEKIADFGKTNKIPEKVLLNTFGLKTTTSLEKGLKETGLTNEQITKKLTVQMAIYLENQKKNWQKIIVKFVLWAIYLIIGLWLMRQKKLNAKNRKWFYLGAVLIFGVILGSDPSPMGTVKDALMMFTIHHAVFLPRMIALTVFLAFVVIANKSICAWGCQLGVLQDLIFRLNRNKKGNRGILRQYKIPFKISNGIRITFFVLMLAIALIWAFDIIEWVDPFKLYNPMIPTLTGWIFIGIVLITSLFVYRPWCHLFCPFGLVGWLFEKLSIFKIKVDYQTCIACDACSKACPSDVMDHILKREKKTIPDCFACGNCMDVCPTDSISFASGKRDLPPAGKFDHLKKNEVNG